MKFQSVKRIEGFSTCFRQWRAEGTHCKFIHGYAIYFEVTFEGELDYRNWVMDFGFMKRSKTPAIILKGPGNSTVPLGVGDWFKYMFDHTIVIAKDDPDYPSFMELNDMKIAQVREVDNVGCEMFAKLVFDVLNAFLKIETDSRCRVVKVQCFEHNKNSAIYTE